MLLYGESSSGKSTLAVDFGMHIATGRDLLGRACSTGLVVHVAGEGVSGLGLRVRAHRKAHALDDVPYAIVKRAIDLAQTDDVQWLIETIEKASRERGMPAALVIVDTLARCAAIDENSSAEMGTVISGCDRVIRETGATVLLVHHTGKDRSNGPRGSSALHAAVDAEIEVRGTRGVRQVEVKKQRDGDADISWQCELRTIELGLDPETGDAITACYVEHIDRAPAHALGQHRAAQSRGGKAGHGRIQQVVLEIIRKHAGDTGVRISKPALVRIAGSDHGVKRSASVYDAVKSLVEAGKLDDADGGVSLVGNGHVLPGKEEPVQAQRLQ
jgi:hypothetical protein